MKPIIYTSYVAVLIVMGVATFVENAQGNAFVHQHIYGAWWFATLWGVLAIVSALYIIKNPPRGGGRWSVWGIKGGFLLILCGALLSHISGRSGQVHLRRGERQTIAQIEHCGKTYYHRLNFDVELTDFEIVEGDDGKVVDYVSRFAIGGDTCTVSMNSIATYGNIRFYQSSYDSDLLGSTLLINRDPYGIPVTYCGYGLLFVSFLWLCLRRRGRHKMWFGCIVLTGVWCVYYFILDGSWAQIPVLRSPLLFVHVVVIIMAYSLLLIQTVVSLGCLCGRREGVASSGGLLRPALALLSTGIFLGAIWANISWGNYWSWDSKEVWALITLMVYAVPAHQRSLPVFREPKVFHLYMVASFLTVLMTYFGVNHFLTGLHSYN